MTIIHEMLSRDGSLQSRVIEDVRSLRKADNVLIKESKKPVIWVKADKQYTIVFPTTDLRDKAFNKLQEPVSAVILDMENYFWDKLIDDNIALSMSNKRLSRHLQLQIEYITKENDLSLVELNKRDAFKCFSLKQLQDIVDNNSISIEINYQTLLIWSKTLLTPRDELKKGLNHLQFFKVITKNEKFWNISSNDIFS